MKKNIEVVKSMRCHISRLCIDRLVIISIFIFLLSAAGCNIFDHSVDPDAIIEKDCGELNTGKNVLVAYATRHKSTAGIAEKIADVLCGLNHRVDLRYVENVSSIEGYDAVIVGSAIYEFNLLPVATDFIERFKLPLASMPVAYFFGCAALKEDTPENQEGVLIYINPVLTKYPDIVPVDIGRFGGGADFSRLNAFEKMIMNFIGVTKSEDWRDWAKIGAWAEKVSGLID
jgi:menaquinone-dependent protoporphyrinogen oxidase